MEGFLSPAEQDLSSHDHRSGDRKHRVKEERPRERIFFKIIFLRGTWDISSLMRDWTHSPGIGSIEF